MSNVLMASTYPLEVVRAERWMTQNKNLKSDALKTAAEKQDWDASVKALMATPSVLEMMNEHLDWTQKLGEAFLAQQQDVMDAVQRMRAKAYDRNKLVTTKEQKVTGRRSRTGRSSTSNPRYRTPSTFPITNRRWSLAIGHTPTIRPIPTTGVIPATSPPV